MRGIKALITVGLFAGIMIYTVACGENILSDLAETDTNDALFFEAKIEMDAGNWSTAINLFEQMSSDYLNSSDVAFSYASAYAGRCGLNFLTLVENLENAGTTKFFIMLMRAMVQSNATKIADCQQAESIIESVQSDPSSRTVDENLLMAFVGFAKIGAIANTYADTDNNNSPDVGFDACAVGDLPDSDARHIGSGLVNAINAMNAAATAGSTIVSGEVTNLNSGCSDLGTLAPTYNFCAVTDPSSYTADQVKGIRSVVQENEWIGLGTCNDTLDNCLCP